MGFLRGKSIPFSVHRVELQPIKIAEHDIIYYLSLLYTSLFLYRPPDLYLATGILRKLLIRNGRGKKNRERSLREFDSTRTLLVRNM